MPWRARPTSFSRLHQPFVFAYESAPDSSVSLARFPFIAAWMRLVAMVPLFFAAHTWRDTSAPRNVLPELG